MNNFLSQGLNNIRHLTDTTLDSVSEKWSLFRETINDLPILASLERTKNSSEIKYDEKHYFVVPFKLSEVGISLHTMRCLPDGIPEINDLPKRRVFHFPNKHAEGQVRELLLQQGRDIARASSSGKKHTIESLANDIDKLDKKLTYGMLLVGGAAAFVNPVLGVGIAAKALLPGVGSLVNKYGLKPLGEKLTKNQLEKEVLAAEKRIISEFEHATTLQLVNPILEELDLALRTNESEHDPLIDFDISSMDINGLDSDRWRELTERAIFHVYERCLKDQSSWDKACLGPEDIRWLTSLLVSQVKYQKE